MVNNATQWDFALFEETPHVTKHEVEEKRAKQKQELKLIQGYRQRIKTNMVRVMTILITSVIAVGLFSVLINQKLTYDQYRRDIETMENKINAVKSQNIKLESDIGGLNSLKVIEDYAVNELGMIKGTEIPCEYIDLSSSDKVVYYKGMEKSHD